MRPAGVDKSNNPEIENFAPKKTGLEGVLAAAVLPVLRATMSSMISPTKDLGRYLTELASGDGSPKEGAGVDGEGRTINNAAFRRFVGI